MPKKHTENNEELFWKAERAPQSNPPGGSEIVIYQTDDGLTRIEVRMEEETVWLTQAQMVELFQSSKASISEHIRHLFEERELDEISVVRNFRTTAAGGKSYSTKHYNLDVIISVGYRVKSLRGTQFRRWATGVLREYLIKGFAVNDPLLKQAGGGQYWRELLERIRDIRSSEKMLYRQVLDLYATSVDYDPRTAEAQQFFKAIQNKLHFAAHGRTASQIIAERANAELPFMGLTAFAGQHPSRPETTVAKNDLSTDDFARRYGQGVLQNAGAVSHETAMEKARAEYERGLARIRG